MAEPNRLLRKLAEVGPVYAGILALQRVLPRRVLWFFRWSLYLLDTRAVRPQEPMPARWAGEGDAALLGGFGHAREVILERLAQGSLACVLESAGQLQAYVWFKPTEYFDAEARTRFRLQPGDIWLYDAMVAPQLRGQHIYPRLLATAATMLRDRGFERIWILIDDLNRNSIRAHCAAGAVARQRYSIVEVCGLARISGEHTGASWLRPGRTHVTEIA